MKNAPPEWFTHGMGHIWLPYTQMKTAADPLPVARTQGSRITLADGREVMQVRLPLGIEQYELSGRPDGHRPHDAESAFDYHLERSQQAGTL